MYDRHMKYLRPNDHLSRMARGGSGKPVNNPLKFARSDFEQLDKILGRDMKQSSKIFNRGNHLKGGLINSNAIIQSVAANEWKDAIKKLEQNPKLLLDQMPSPKRKKSNYKKF